MTRSIESQFAKARSAIARSDFPEAARIYCDIVSRFPGNIKVQKAWTEMKQRIADASGPHVEQAFRTLLGLYEAGRHAEALAQLEPLLAAQSGQPALHNLHGALLLALRRPADGEAALRKAIALEPAVADGYNNLGNALKDQKRFEEARDAYEQAIRRNQDYPEAWNNLAITLQELGHFTEALAAYDTSLALRPDIADTISNRATALLAQQRFVEAEADFRKALALRPDHPQILNNLGDCLLKQERFAEAVATFRRAVELRPDYGDGWTNLGVALRRTGDVAGALEAYERAMALAPDMGTLRLNRANLLMTDGQDDAASLEYLAALEQDPEDTVALNNLGAILQGQGHYTHALMLFERALAIDPGYVDARVNRGNALRDLGWLKEAEEAMSSALADNPKVAALWMNLAVARQDLGQVEGAIAAYARTLELDPDQAEARMQMLYQRAQTCDWSAYDRLDEDLDLIERSSQTAAAFPALAMRDDPAFQYRRSQVMARRWASVAAEPLAPAEPLDGRRLRIGYFSGDFHDHAIMFLASGLFREHDKSRFEIFAYSSGLVRHGVMRDRLIADVEHFHDTVEMAERSVFDLARSHKLDIAVDVSGYTKGSRTGLFARRIAPLQINYLGYPGTMAAPFMDYVVVDPMLVPPEERTHVSERQMIMPGSYQPNDNARVIAGAATTRADFGLPEDAFVFCCFNQGFKITPREFDIWMRLLAKVPASVLWLRAANEAMRVNLCREAELRGVAPERLVFAERAPQAEHLERHRHADLFLDTFSYNAHTTMSDALWAGLPAVTRLGRQFAARVGASLLHAVGLDELVAHSDSDYEELALSLARDPSRLAQIRARLSTSLPTAPLFDTVGYTRALEAGFTAACERHHHGLPPEDFAISLPS